MMYCSIMSLTVLSISGNQISSFHELTTSSRLLNVFRVLYQIGLQFDSCTSEYRTIRGGKKSDTAWCCDYCDRISAEIMSDHCFSSFVKVGYEAVAIFSSS